MKTIVHPILEGSRLVRKSRRRAGLRPAALATIPLLSGCTLLGIGGGKQLPPKPQESPQYVELLREHVDLARQAAERFDAEGTQPASPLTAANLAVALAVQAVVGSPLYRQSFAALAEEPRELAKLGLDLKAEKAEHVDATAAWESQVEEVRASLRDAVRQNGVLSRFTDAVTLWVRWIGAGVLALATAALVLRALLLKQNQALAILTGVAGVVAVGLWIWLAGTLVRIALWGVAIAAVAAAGYGAYVLFSGAKTKEWLDRQIKAIQTFRHAAPTESTEMLEAELDKVSNPAMRGYVDARKDALALPRAAPE